MEGRVMSNGRVGGEDKALGWHVLSGISESESVSSDCQMGTSTAAQLTRRVHAGVCKRQSQQNCPNKEGRVFDYSRHERHVHRRHLFQLLRNGGVRRRRQRKVLPQHQRQRCTSHWLHEDIRRTCIAESAHVHG
jgi:hypothetical protein